MADEQTTKSTETVQTTTSTPVPPSGVAEWLGSLSLPQGSDLALWWIGVIAVAALFKIPDPTVVVGNLASGLIGYIGGKKTK